MRIVHVIDDLNEQAGGPAQACIEMAAAVAIKGHHVSIYAFGDRRPAWFPAEGRLPMTTRHAGVEVHLVPGRASAWFAVPGLYAALSHAVRGADVVHAHVLYGFHLWAAWRLCRRHEVPLIVRPCGILNPYVRSARQVRARLIELAFQSRMLRQATLIHYTTEQEAADAGAYVGNQRLAIVPLGINLPAYDDLPPRAEFDIHYPEARGRKIVLYFGRLHRKKRLDLVIEAFAAAIRDDHDLHLLIGGPDDGMGEQCRILVDANGISDRTTFTGLLVQEAKRIAFGSADVFVLPSMTENFGIAVAEAAASFIPLLISDRVNIAPVFGQADAAVIVPPDLEALADGLRTLIQKPFRAEAMAARARQIVEQQFTWDAVANDLVSMYRDVSESVPRSSTHTPAMPNNADVGAFAR